MGPNWNTMQAWGGSNLCQYGKIRKLFAFMLSRRNLLENTYSEIIHPMLGQNEWIETGLPTPIPPRILRPLSIPKKLRTRDLNEPRNPFKVSQMNKEV